MITATRLGRVQHVTQVGSKPDYDEFGLLINNKPFYTRAPEVLNYKPGDIAYITGYGKWLKEL